MELDKEKAQSILNTLKRPDFSDSLELAKELAVKNEKAFQIQEPKIKRTFLKPKNPSQIRLIKITTMVALVVVLGIVLSMRSHKKTRDLTVPKPSDPQNSAVTTPQEPSDPNSALKPPTRPQRN